MKPKLSVGQVQLKLMFLIIHPYGGISMGEPTYLAGAAGYSEEACDCYHQHGSMHSHLYM